MSRQINLYSPVFRRQRKPFSAIWSVAAFLITATLMSTYYAFVDQQVRDLRSHRKDAELRLKQVRDQLVGAGKLAQKTNSKALEEQIAHAEALLKGRQELIGRLKSGEIGNRDGYSKFLLALARQHLEGVWLTSIEISGPRDDFAIQGRALRADLLSEYIKMLRKEEAFRGKPIGTLALRERELDPKGDRISPTGSAQAAGVSAPAAPSQKSAPPAVRVVEFAIGTAFAAGAEAAKK